MENIRFQPEEQGLTRREFLSLVSKIGFAAAVISAGLRFTQSSDVKDLQAITPQSFAEMKHEQGLDGPDCVDPVNEEACIDYPTSGNTVE